MLLAWTHHSMVKVNALGARQAHVKEDKEGGQVPEKYRLNWKVGWKGAIDEGVEAVYSGTFLV